MIRRRTGLRKCANLPLFLLLHLLDGFAHFTDDHLRNIADCGTEHGDNLHGVEVKEVAEILPVKILSRLIPRTGERHKSDAAFQRGFQPCLKVCVIQLLQKAAGFDSVQLHEII